MAEATIVPSRAAVARALKLQAGSVLALEVGHLSELVRELHDALPPADLPAVLSSVDDLPGVCAAAGLVREEPRPGDSGRWAVWTDGVVSVVPAYGISGLAIVALRGTGIASISPGAPTRVLWSAIQAVRGGEN